MIYNSVSGAVVAALVAGEKGAAKGQAWQRLYQADEESGGCLASLGGGQRLDRAQVDYWLSARLHHQLSAQHWDALVARYGTSKAMRVQAITRLRPQIHSAAPTLFIFKAVTAWAIPKLKGLPRKAPVSVSVELPLDAPEWRRESMVNAALAAGKSARSRIESQQEEVVVLPNSFYDMNTWDPDGTPESTRRRWRLDIFAKLDELVQNALLDVRDILLAEGLIIDDAA